MRTVAAAVCLTLLVDSRWAFVFWTTLGFVVAIIWTLVVTSHESRELTSRVNGDTRI